MTNKKEFGELQVELTNYYTERQKASHKVAAAIDQLTHILENDPGLAASVEVVAAMKRLNKTAAGKWSAPQKASSATETFDWDKLVQILKAEKITNKKMGVGKAILEKLYFGNSDTKFEPNKWNDRDTKEAVLDFDPEASNKLRKYWLKKK